MKKSKQVKITVEPEVASAFKKACAKSGVTMTEELLNFMIERASILSQSYGKNIDLLRSRGGRRRETAAAISKLETIRDAEADYMDRIPPNLQGGPAYEAAENAVEQIDQAVDMLRDAF